MANVGLFASLLLCRFYLSTSAEMSFGLLLTYMGLLLAMGASIALIAAPAGYWRQLVKVAPIEISIALLGGAITIAAGALSQESWELLSTATLMVSEGILRLYEFECMVRRT